jgi:hypothetical protein
MERPPGYSAPPGYDEDDDASAPLYANSAQTQRLLPEEPSYNRTFVYPTLRDQPAVLML